MRRIFASAIAVATLTVASPAAAAVYTSDPRPIEGTQAEPFWTAAPATAQETRFLACLRRGESRGNYWSVSRTGKFRGAYQFHSGTWNGLMARYGLDIYVGVPPEWGHPVVQDRAALLLYRERGWRPWPTVGRRCARRG